MVATMSFINLLSPIETPVNTSFQLMFEDIITWIVMTTTNAYLSGIYMDVQIVLHFLVIFKYCLVLYNMVQNSTASNNVLSEL